MPSVKLTLVADFKGAADKMAKALKETDAHTKKIVETVKTLDTSKFQEFVSKSRLMGASVQATRGPMAGLIAQQRNLGQNIEKLIRQGLDPQSKEMKILREEYMAVSQQAVELANKQKDLLDKSKALKKATEEQSAAMKEATDTAADYVKYGILALLTATALLSVGMLKNSALIEDAEAAFRPMLGSLDKAKVLVDMINETAAKTPFQFEAISTSVKQLLPAVRGSMGEVIKTFRMLGDVSSGNAQRLDSVTRAFTKSMLRGRVDMRSLNMIARAGVPIFSELGRSMGVTTEQLFTMSKKGQISSAALVKAFEMMTSKGGMFYKGMEIASKTLTGRISTLKDNIILLSANLGNVLLPYAKQFVETSLSIVGSLRAITKDTVMARAAMDLLGAAFVLTTTSMVAFFVVLKGAAAWTFAMTMAKGLWAVLAANPLGALLGALVSLNVAIWTMGQGMGNLKFVMKTHMEEGWEAIKNVFKVGVLELEQSFKELGLAMSRVFSHSLRFTVEGVMLAIAKKAGWLINKIREWGGLGTNKVIDNINKGWEKSLEVREKVSAASYKRDAKNIDNTYTQLITKQLAASFKARSEILSRLKDAKLAAGAFGGKNNSAEGGEGTLDDKLRNLQDPNDNIERNKLEAINVFKGWMKDRMELLRVAKGAETKFLNDEAARYMAMNALNKDEKEAAKIAAEEMITAIAEKASKKRVVNAQKEAKATFDALLGESVGSKQARRYLDEEKSLRSHLASRISDLKIAKEDEAAFLQAEAERLASFSKFNGDQKVRIAKTINEMLLAEHKKHLAEMDEITRKAAEKEAKEKLKQDEAIRIRQRLIEGESKRYKIVATRNAEMVRSAISGVTDLFVNAAETGAWAFKDMAQSIMSDIYRIMINRMVTDFITQLLPMSRRTSPQAPSYADISPSADSRVTLGENAAGLIAAKPSIGIFGEKGPEAVLPLVRKGGVLGVGAPVGGSSNGGTTVQIINTTGAEVEQSSTKDPFGNEQITLLFRQKTKNDLDNGVFDSNMKRYGLRPQPMGR
jgi:tape measure domain-containing protein